MEVLCFADDFFIGVVKLGHVDAKECLDLAEEVIGLVEWYLVVCSDSKCQFDSKLGRFSL